MAERIEANPADLASVDRHDLILNAAEQVFSQHGYSATTMDAVAAEAGVAKGSLYNYFDSKQQLFTRLYNYVMRRDFEKLDSMVRQSVSAGERIERVLDDWAERVETFRVFGALMLEFWATAAREQNKGAFGEEFTEHYEQARLRVAEIVRQGMESGEFADHLIPEVAASLIMAVIRGITVQLILGFDEKVSEELLDALKRSVLTSLTQPQEE